MHGNAQQNIIMMDSFDKLNKWITEQKLCIYVLIKIKCHGGDMLKIEDAKQTDLPFSSQCHSQLDNTSSKSINNFILFFKSHPSE